MKQKLKSKKGITLIALVVTIVVLLILASVTINFILGDDGLFSNASNSKEIQEAAQLKDRISNIIASWHVDKLTKPSETDINDLFDKLKDEGIIDNIDKDVRGPDENNIYEVITKDGYKVEIDAEDPSNPNVGTVVNTKKLKPEITEILTTSTTNSIYVKVNTEWLGEKGKVTCEYRMKKEEGQTEENAWVKQELNENFEANITGLTQEKIYEIKITASNENGSTVTEPLINVRTGKLETGTIDQVGDTEWNNNKAKIYIESSDKEHTLQYQIITKSAGMDFNPDGWINYDNTIGITDIEYNQAVYTRMYDGSNGSAEKEVEIIDSKEPTITVTEKENASTTRSITVTVNVADNEFGMPDTITYNYYVANASGNYQSTATGTKTTSKESSSIDILIDNLEDGQSYKVKVTATDKAGNEGEGELLNISTGEVTGATANLASGVITAGTPSWNKSTHTASVTLQTSSTLTLEYQVGGITESNWSEAPKNSSGAGSTVTVPNITHNQTVYARLSDGYNQGQEAGVTVLDKTLPSVATFGSFSKTNPIPNEAVTIKVTHIDDQSGVNITSCKWVYVKQNSKTEIGTNPDSYTGGVFSSNGQQLSLKATTAGTYYLHVLTVDNAGNKKESIAGPIGVTKPVTGVKLNTNAVTLKVGGTAAQATTTLTATVEPSDATNKNVTWSSSNNTVATVSNGTITAKAKGSATITVRTADGGKTVTCTVTVTQLVTGVSISSTSASLKVGQTTKLTATATPAIANNRNITWSTNASAVATVATDGTITAKAPGTAVITATAADGSGKKASCTVTVSYYTVAEKLKAGDYVYYTDKNNVQRKCVVLYDNSSGYGVQIITMDTVENYTIGNGTTSNQTSKAYVDACIPKFNTAITDLNSIAEKYRNATYSSSARSVGSMPNNKNSESGFYTNTSSYMSGYTGKIKDEDYNYEKDVEQMVNLGIKPLGKYYWLASRRTVETTGQYNLHSVRCELGCVFNDDDGTGTYRSTITIGKINQDGTYSSSKNLAYGVRPVFTLINTIKVKSGNGTSASPYYLST